MGGKSNEQPVARHASMPSVSLHDRLLDAFSWHDGHADVWAWFRDGDLLADLVTALAAPFAGARLTKIAAVEARGFLLGAPVAVALGCGFVAVRKDGALLAGEQFCATTPADYRGRAHVLRLQRSALNPRDQVAVVDDWWETGSQARAVRHLVEGAGATYRGSSIIVDQLPETVRNALAPVSSLVRADELPRQIGN
jgi:adenine phosphoribosyltransferase